MRMNLIKLFCLLSAALLMESAIAQTRQIPASEEAIRLSFASIVKQVAPAVVNVYASRQVRQRVSPFINDPFFRRFFGDLGGGMPKTRLQSSLGSGVIIDSSGIVITNNHVIRDALEVKIALSDRREYECEILLKDERTDLALLKIKDKEIALPKVQIANADTLEVGDLVLAIGNPFGVGQTVTQGIVSALARTKIGVTDYQFFIQTDAAINPGNSGGALIDMTGKLVGINTAIFSRSGGSNGIGFAIPASMVRLLVQSAQDGVERVRRPWFGAEIQAVTSDIAESLGLDRPSGILVTKVDKNSPADNGGLQRGDLIIAIDGNKVNDPQAFGYRFATKGLGGETTISILRQERNKDLKIALKPAPETIPRDMRDLGKGSPFQGATVVNLSPAVAEELSVSQDQGVIVTQIASGSAANNIGLLRGDIVINVNGTNIDTTKTLARETRKNTRLWRLQINRNGRLLRMTFRG